MIKVSTHIEYKRLQTQLEYLLIIFIYRSLRDLFLGDFGAASDPEGF